MRRKRLEWRPTLFSRFCFGVASRAMYLRFARRRKDGKEHRYWSIVESRRCAGGRVVQRPILYLGEINDGQREAWCPAILKVAHFLDSQISGEVIHRWDGAFAFPSGWFARGLRDFSGPPEGAERQYRDDGFRSGGLRPVFHAKRVVSVVPAHP